MKPFFLKTVATVLALLTVSRFAVFAEEVEWQFTLLRSFGNPEKNAYASGSGLMLASDGLLYGTTYQGGFGGGTLFSVSPSGGQFRQLHTFTNYSSLNGYYPIAGLLEASNGKLYGTTARGGSNDFGTLFSLNKDGTGFEVLHHFVGTQTDGRAPYGDLIEGSDGRLYGTAITGGANSNGIIFRLEQNGSGFEILHHFGGFPNDGTSPEAQLVEGSDGWLYGTSTSGTDEEDHLISARLFKLSKDGSGYQVLHDFGQTNDHAANVYWGLAEGSDGALYGVAEDGGSGAGNIVFKIQKDGANYQVLHNFGDQENAPIPFGPLVKGRDGRFYGVTRTGGKYSGGIIFALAEDGSRFEIVQELGRNPKGVALPIGALAVDANGKFYGVSRESALSPSTVYRFDNSGIRVLWTFNRSGGDGMTPYTSLARGHDGTLFGTTARGGSAERGTIFRIQPDGSGYEIVWNFPRTDTFFQPAGIIADTASSNLFLTSYGTGKKGMTLFRLSPDGKSKILRRFSTPDGPISLPLQDNGILYGATASGGAGWGTIFSIGKEGQNYRVLHEFTQDEGWSPSLQLGRDGFLYGACASGGNFGGGSFFRLNRDGTGFTVLREFRDPFLEDASTNISRPVLLFEYGDEWYGLAQKDLDTQRYFKVSKDGGTATVLRDLDGLNLTLMLGDHLSVYGTVGGMGFEDGGTIFRMALDGSDFTALHTFSELTREQGVFPVGTLLQSTDDTIFGTTSQGGTMDLGTVFKLKLVKPIVPTPL